MKKQIDHHTGVLRFLKWICPFNLYEGIEGDLMEQWNKDKERLGRRRAKLKLMWNSLLFLRPSIVFRNKFDFNLIETQMWRNYLIVGWRSIISNRFYSFINLIGLALGIGFSFLTFLYVSGELDYDKFHEKANRICRVVEKKINVTSMELVGTSSVTAIPLANALLENYPEIESVARYGSFGSVVKKGEDSFSQVVVVADKEFFDLFDYSTLKGDQVFFDDPSDLVLSVEAARTYFGNEEAVGQALMVTLKDSSYLFTVAAVVDNHKSESSFVFDVMIPFENLKHIVGDEVWTSFNYGFIETYLLVQEPGRFQMLEAKINEQYLDKAEEESANTANIFRLQPFTQMHLDNNVPSGIARPGNPVYVYVLSGVGLLILFMACINFISLTSSHSFNRVKEIGVRKTMGAIRSQIRNQLVAESFLICLFSTIFGLILVYFSVPVFNQLINSTVELNFSLENSLFLMLLVIIISLVAGGIPARLLIALQPVQALKSGIKNSGTEFTRTSLVVIQFTLSIALIIGTLIMNDQMNFISEKNLGFEKERLYEVSLNNPSSAEEASQLVGLYKTEASSANRVMSVSAAMNDYQEPWTKLGFEQVEGEPIGLFFNLVEPAYLKTMGLEMVNGRWFDENAQPKGSRQIVVNESLVKYFNWDSPIGMQIPGKNFSAAHEIIGVVKDFHFSSLHNKVEPLILALDQEAIISGVTGLTTYRWPPLYNSMIVKISPGELQGGLKELEAIWRKVNADAPFQGHFVDQLLDAQYANEQRWKRVINYSSIFAFSIAILGLIGLVRLLLQRKTKEIGIRKVLGSGYIGLATHFSKGFVSVLLGANLIGWPIAWWAGKQWLQSFTYRVDLTIVPFATAAIAVCMAVFTVVGYLTWVASQTRPVDVLRNE